MWLWSSTSSLKHCRSRTTTGHRRVLRDGITLDMAWRRTLIPMDLGTFLILYIRRRIISTVVLLFHSTQERPTPLWFNQPEASRPVSAYPLPHVEARRPPPPPPMMSAPHDVVMRNNNVVREINDRNSLNVTRRNEPNPDYSPPMPRHNNPYDQRQRSTMNRSRFWLQEPTKVFL